MKIKIRYTYATLKKLHKFDDIRNFLDKILGTLKDLVETKEHESNKLFGYWCLETIYILSAQLNFYLLKRDYDKKIFKDMITNINSF